MSTGRGADGVLRVVVPCDGVPIPPTWRDVGWPVVPVRSRGEQATLDLFVDGLDPKDPDGLILDYRTQRYSEPWQDVREAVLIERTGCHYGGTRPWLRCPRCLSRRAVLFSKWGRFRCRACHDLAYSSTRETEGDRMMRRAAVIRKRLGAPSSGYLWGWVPKPKGMRWATYDRLRGELRACQYGAMADITARGDKLLAQIDRRLGANR